MRASNVVTHLFATSSFGLKMRIDKAGGNRESVLSVATDSCDSVRKRRCGLMEERWFSTDWKLNLRPRILQNSREKVLEEVSKQSRSSAED